MAFERRGYFSEIGHSAVALHFSNAAVAECDFAGEARISGGFLRQIFQIFESAAHEQLAGGCRAGKFFDGVVEFEHDGVGEFFDIVKTALGAAGFEPGESGEGKNQRGGERGGGNGNAMAAEKLSGSVRESGGARVNRLTFEVAAEVGGKFV